MSLCPKGSFRKAKPTRRISTEVFSRWEVLPGMEAKRGKREHWESPKIVIAGSCYDYWD